MSDRTSKFASAILIAALCALPVTAIGLGTANAEECLKEPTGAAPDGQHWYYHNDHNTQQRCWYLRDLDDKAARAEAQLPAASARTAPAAAKADATTEGSLADAYAELPARRGLQTDTTTRSAQQPPGAAAVAPLPAAAPVVRATDVIWPGQPSTADSDAAPPSSAAPDNSAPPVADPSAGDSPTATANAAAAPPAVTPADPTAPIGDKNYKNPGSLQKLLLVAAGALALAGLTGSAVYRLASLGRRRRSKNRWPKRARRPQPAARRQPAGPREPQFAKVSAVSISALDDIAREEPAPVNGESLYAPRRTPTRRTAAPVERIEVIEEFLARFAKQAQHQ